MNAELRAKLEEYAASQGYSGGDDATIAEVLTEAKTVQKDDYDKHRWYTTFSRVVDVAGIFVAFSDYENSGDEPAFDSDDYQNMVLEDAVEVFPQTVEVTTYSKNKE